MLSLIKQFITDNARRLEQQLSQFEQNVATELAALFDGMVAQPQQVRFTPQTSVDKTLTTRQIALCDLSTGNIAFALSAPADGKPGFLWIAKRATTNTVTVRPSGMANNAARLINGAASKAYGAGTVGLFAIYYDGANWWAS